MLTVLLTLVRRPTLSKTATRRGPTRRPSRRRRRTPPTGVVPPFLSLPFPRSLQLTHLSSAGLPLSPTIFNVVVDAVVRHCIDGIVDKIAEKGETGREGRHQSEVFYANNSMVVSSDPAWLQGAFSALVAIFDRVGLRTNVGKTVSMA